MSEILQMDKFIKRKEVAKILSISDNTLKSLIDEKKLIIPIKIDGFQEKLFSLNELKKWMDDQKRKRENK